MSIFNQEDFTGGLSLLDNTKIEDNQLSTCTNMYYDADGRCKTRRGYTQWATVPDSAQVVNLCDSATDWSVSGDATNLTLDTTNEIRGTGALNFDLSAYSTGTSKLTLAASATIDISSDKGYVGFWVKFPTSYDTDLTSVRFRLGSDSSNYYIWTLTNPTAATATWIKLDFDDATTTGTPADTVIDFAELEFTTDAGYVGYTDFIIDDIRVYASTTTKPATSLFSYKNETTKATTTICTAGTNMFLYNVLEAAWEQIDSSLTEFETGSTVNRTRWSFISYNDVIYGVNGLDGYKTWNGTVMATDAGIKGKYLAFLSGVAFISGSPDAPNAVSYTAKYPADLSAYANTFTKVGADEEGPVNGLHPVGNLMIAFKNDKSYYLDIFGTSDLVVAIDSYNGGYSHRCTKNVGNGILYYTGIGIETLKQKASQIGAAALESKPFSDSLRSSFTDVSPAYYNSNCSHYIKELTNYYVMIDTGADDKPETTYVYSSLIGDTAWTKYSYPTSYDFARYEAATGSVENLMCSSSSGIIYKIESGFNDNGNAISHEFYTKEWDFGDLTQSKEYTAITISGLRTKGFDQVMEIYVDGEIEDRTVIDGSYTTSDSPVGTVGSDPVGDVPIGGELDPDSVDLYPYICRVYKHITGRKIQVRIKSEAKNAQWSVDKINIAFENMDFDEFPTQFEA